MTFYFLDTPDAIERSKVKCSVLW